jgi:actin-like ATPase involved in cell morphogenesis
MYGPTPSGPALGIDLGTSHTIGVVRRLDGAVRTLLFDGSPLLPSAVYAAPDGILAVGRDAVHSGRRHPERFEPNPKRHIDASTVLLGDREIATTALLAALLRTVAVECRRVVGPPGQVTITVPADWGPQRRNAVGAAAAAAGLGQVRLVPEPVAAASYFAETLGRSIAPGAALVVYDLGAGTFDVSVVRHEAQGFRTVALAGRSDLGGLDIDAALVEHLGTVYGHRDEWSSLTHPSTVEERRALREFQEEIRTAKERLSRHQQADFTIPMLQVEAHLTREELDRIAGPLLERTVALTRQVMADAGVDPARSAGVFLVGGATRMPLVATMLHRALGVAPTVLDQPEIVVAEGGITGAALSAPATPPAPVSPYTPQTPTPPAQPIASSPPRAFTPQQPTETRSLPPTADPGPHAEARPPKMRWPVVIAVIAANIVLVAALVVIFRDRADGTYGPGLYGRTTDCQVELTRETRGVAHPVLPCGARIIVAYGGREVETRVMDKGPYGAGQEFALTQALAGDLGLQGVQIVRWRFSEGR